MEGRMKKYRQLSPERAKVWTEKSPRYHYNHHNNHQQQHSSKVPVVYYLCRNRQLEHPHFMEVTISSPDGLYLRDVIERLNVLRGRGMASMYSWSCKRSYKNGYVWHDLCYDDLILPAHGNEYVLKGSELFQESDSGRFSLAETGILRNQKALPEPPSSGSQEESSSSSSLNGRTTKTSQDDELSLPDQRPCSSSVSPELSVGKNSSWNGSLSLTEYKVYKSDGLADASTQTEENVSSALGARDACTRSRPTDDGLLENEISGNRPNQVPRVKDSPEISQHFVSPPPSTSSASSSSGRTDTLESLIRADARKLSSLRILEEEEFRMPSNSKLKASNMIMQLISCGSISVKDHRFGLIPTYKPSFSNSKFSSPLFSTPSMLGELDCPTENPRLTGMTYEDKRYFSGSLVETSMLKEGVPNLKRSSSFSADRSVEQFDSVEEKEEGNSTRTKCIPISIKATLTKQPRCESMRSPISDGPRISSDRVESSQTATSGPSNGGSKRTIEPLSMETRSSKPDSCRNDNENVIKIEES
ncbi:UNVERIFIED_CONTAM: protein UPSTREAM OF FLC [Sesamum latifolium]|uniref:Protein UPSTREAM OF FLC n=1 Tax=Sesamum latifolium TaxID=2727402 RepID=A0AAW2Y531_9LAMI